MSLAASCPRCSAPVTGDRSLGWVCAEHGQIVPLWRPSVATYDDLAQHLRAAEPIPSLMPWPLSPGWNVTDFGCVGHPDREAVASFVTCSGVSDLDGVVEVTVLTEEPGVGLGARCSGITRTDPGAEIGDGPPHVKVRIEGRPVAMWSVSTSDGSQEFDRSVFAGEARGRWLWLVLRPASAALLLQDEWILCDVAGLGPELIEVPFGGHPPTW